MRIAFFHNWSWLGSAIGHALLQAGQDDLIFFGGAAAPAELDPELNAHAQRRAVPSIIAPDVRDPAFQAEVARFDPELILVGTFAQKLPQSLLSIPRRGGLNVHSSMLPAYRGALPEFWVIRNGEAETGVTIHEMNDRFDEGAILVQAPIAIGPYETLLSLSAKLTQVGPPLVLDLLARLRRGEHVPRIAQDHRRASLAPAVREAHLLIHWTESASSIERLVRASTPVYDAFGWIAGERVIVHGARVLIAGRALAPGEIYADTTLRALLVGTGQGLLALESVEVEVEMMSGLAMAERYGLKNGTRFELV